MTTTTMVRPRLLPGLPILRRGSDQVQIGTNPGHAVVIDGCADVLMIALGELDGRYTRAEWEERIPQPQRGRLRALLDTLSDSPLLEDAATETASGAPALSADTTLWRLRTAACTGPIARSVLNERRASAGVAIYGNGRLAIA
ncbi:MAG: hypothetical protein ACRDRL_25330, partial [Sciscionella sp.]